MIVHTKSAARSDRGRRETNEDCVLHDPELGLLLVADGTAGRSGGQVAARLACETIRDYLAAHQPGARPDTAPLAATIRAAVAEANRRIRADQAKNAAHSGVTTVVVVWLDKGQAHIAHVGDSRVYLLRQGSFKQLTRDHSLGNYLKDNPQLRPKVKRADDTLVRAVGLTEKAPEVDHQLLALEPRDLLLACTDGITEVLSQRVMAEILRGARVTSPESCATCFIRAALSHGASDNLSAGIIAAEDPSATDRSLADRGPGRAIGWVTFFEGQHQGQILPLSGNTRIGGDSSCEVVIGDSFVSSRHAEIHTTGSGFIVKDLKSTNGTFVNEVRISEQELIDGDIVRVGRSSMTFKCYFDG